MAGGTISYVIELDAKEAEAALKGLEGAGNDLFKTLEKTAASLTGGGLSVFEKTLLGASAAVGALTASLFGMAKTSSETVDKLGQLAAQIGSSVEQISSVRSALVQLGANGEQVQAGLQKFGDTVKATWTEVENAVSDAANKIAGDQLRIDKASQRLAKAQIEAKGSADALSQAYLSVEMAGSALVRAQQKVADAADNSNKNLLALQQSVLSLQQAQIALARFSQDAAREQVNSYLSVLGAVQSVKDAELALAQAKGEDVSAEKLKQNAIERAELALQNAVQREAEANDKAAKEQEDRALRRRELVLNEETARQAVADAEKKRSREAQEQQLAELQLEKARLELKEAKKKATEEELEGQNRLIHIREAELRLAKAQEEQRQTELNSIDNLRKYIDALAEGASTAGIKVNASVENIIKGLVASVGPGVEALEGVSGSFGEITRRSPELMPALLKLADVFSHMEDKALKLTIATKLFGKAVAKDMVDALSKGSAELLKQQEIMVDLGLFINKADEAISEQFTAAWNKLNEVISIVATQIGVQFEPMFTKAMESMAKSIGDNRTEIVKWGIKVSEVVGTVIDKIGLLGPVFGLLATAAVVAIRTILVSLGPVGIGLVALSIILGLLIQYWPEISKESAKAWDDVKKAFFDIGPMIERFVTKGSANAWKWISETWNAEWESIKKDWEATKAQFAKFMTEGPANAWKWISETWNAEWESIKKDWEATKAQFAKFMTEALPNAWKWIVETFNNAMTELGKAIDEQIQKLKELLGLGQQVAPMGGPTPGDPSGFAGGGMVGGRGGGTSDSNLAWVSRGEHIMPARAVGQPGVLAFLEALRRSGGNLRRVLDGMGRFALGGMIPSMPAFASAGLNGMSNVTIQFPGLPAISGLRASSDVVDELRKAAAMAQVRSGGRKPSRYT